MPGSKKKGVYVSVFLTAFLLGSGYRMFREGAKRVQPIAYSHRLHVEELGLSCSFCHSTVETGIRATLPPMSTCLSCHDSPQGQSPEEEKIRKFEGKDLPWQRLFVLPPDVYFSHYRHVTLGKIECTTCHGQMASMEEPPPRALKRLRMKTCTSCHAQKAVSQDCNGCHR